MRKTTELSKKDLKYYHNLLDAILKTDDLYTIKSLVESYIKNGNPYITYSSNNNRTTGDCNGDGGINILDIVVLVNSILDQDSDEPDETILQNCDMNGDGILNVVDIVQLVNMILALPDDDDDEWTNDYIWSRIRFLQSGVDFNDLFHDETWEPFDYTRNTEVHDLSYTGGYSLEEHGMNQNVVLITAPHASRCYRPTKWNSAFNPSSGLYYCDHENDTICDKPDDYCTGAMAKTLAEMVGATVLYTRGRQQDPNYYEWLGFDDRGHEAEENWGSGNVADPLEGYYEYGGIQTGAFYEDFEDGMRVPFKEELFEYLTTHSEIKLVIDLHGASSTSNRWDIDLGLLGDNGQYGINTEDNQADWMDSLDIGNMPGSPPTLEMDFLMEMMSVFYQHEIGRCSYICADGGYDDCQLEGDCPEGMTGHGPISFNDFAGSTDGTVTKFVNKYFGDSVQAVQFEVSSFYRCLDGRDEENVKRFMRVLEEIVERANIYYGNGRSNGSNSSDKTIKGYRHV